MSGHSKWSQIKRQKGVTDAKRGQLFTKLAREITVAARQGGGDPASNFRLRLAVQRAHDANMPHDNVDRAVKRGTGEGAAHDALMEVTYEGYTPGGAAVLIQVVTDNKNRTLSDLRKVLTQSNARLGDPGSVAWMFAAKGVVHAQAPNGAADDLALAAIDAGAEDVKTDGDALEVYASPEKLEAVRRALAERKAAIASSEVQMVPNTVTPLEAKAAEQALKLLDRLEELDDVQKVYTNAEFPDAMLAQAAG